MASVSGNILKIINYSGISRLIRRLSSDRPKIIMYHGVIDNDNHLRCWWQLKESDFEDQIHYIKNNFSVISIDELNELIRNKNRPPKNACVLTFDDGYRSYMTRALPVLDYYKLPSVVYVSPGVVQKQKMIWTDEIFLAICQTSRTGLDLSDIEMGRWDLKTKEKKSKTAHRLTNALKDMPIEKKNDLVASIYEKLGYKRKEDSQDSHTFKLLSRNEIETISTYPLVTIGSHSLNHEILTKLSIDEVEGELRESKQILEEWIQKPVRHFSYPDGKYNSEIASLVKTCGYKTATRIGLGRFDAEKPFELNRLGTGSWNDFTDFKAMMDGVITIKTEIIERSKMNKG